MIPAFILLGLYATYQHQWWIAAACTAGTCISYVVWKALP